MLDPPSADLLRTLRDLRLCTPRDLRRCRGRVRRLAWDLPAFDSVWIDALVQLGRLTPFQASVLESDHPRRLQVGPCVLVERLGGGPRGATYLAQTIATRQPCVLKLLDVPADRPDGAWQRLERLIHQSADAASPQLVAPHACDQWDGRWVLVSRFAPGRRLDELLIRRGRYAPAVVAEIGSQLLEGLIPLWQRQGVHGDIRAGNVRLGPDGRAVLVDAGIQPALAPELTPYADLPPERFDGVAPELIGTGRTAAPASDLYALGCLLWQLLAGRPPFPGGDPLVKLAAHQTRRVIDVREWAPETPPALAAAVLAFTARDPAQRPADVAAVRRLLPAPRRSGRVRLQQFAAQFDGDDPAASPAAASGALWASALCVLLGLGGVWASRGAPALLSIWNPAAAVAMAEVPAPQAADEPRADVVEAGAPLALAWPATDAQGVVQLAAGTYDATELQVVGPLVVRGAEGGGTEIRVGRRPLSLVGASVLLENVRLTRTDAAEGRPARALVRVQSQTLEVRRCAWHVGSFSSDEAAADGDAPIGLAWRMIDPDDRIGGTLALRDVLIAGDGIGCYLAGRPQHVELTNVLKAGGGALLELATTPATTLDLLVRLEAVTCRAGTSVVAWRWGPGPTAASRVVVEADDCVFALPPKGALFELAGALPPGWERHVQWVGGGSLAKSPLHLARLRRPGAEVVPLPDGALDVEGLLAADFDFAGPLSPDPEDAVVTGDEVPRRDGRIPGIQPEGFAGGGAR